MAEAARRDHVSIATRGYLTRHRAKGLRELTSQGSDGVEVAWVTFSQDDGRRPITASIGDGDRLTSLNRARCGSESQISLGGRMSSEGREAEDDRLEQLHFESMWKL